MNEYYIRMSRYLNLFIDVAIYRYLSAILHRNSIRLLYKNGSNPSRYLNIDVIDKIIEI